MVIGASLHTRLAVLTDAASRSTSNQNYYMNLKKSWDLTLVHGWQEMLMTFGLELMYGSQKGCSSTQKPPLIYTLSFRLGWVFFLYKLHI